MGDLLKRICSDFRPARRQGTQEYDELIDRNGSQEITLFEGRSDYEDMIMKVVAEFKDQMKQGIHLIVSNVCRKIASD
jgi:hypothetical protein